jgi:hypothetical protein
MKLEYVERVGDQYSPLVRLYNFGETEARWLHSAFLALAVDSIQSFDLTAQPWIEVVGNCRLILRRSERDKGLNKIADPDYFECEYSDEGWAELAGKTEPFLDRQDPLRDQWLTDQEGDIQFLLSPDGRW